MVWEIPYTFIAGTKAKANEVNGNFTSIKQFVDQLESNLATAELDINNLETNKADINGNQDEVFQVADAENNKDAVNLETLKAQTANTLDVIRGFVPSKSNKNTISCTAGDCWDSTYEVIINSSTSLSLQDTTLAASTTYYIYVCYDKETSTCKLAFSTNASTPTLPAGFDNFRKIGNFTTDEDKNIQFVFAEGAVQFPAELSSNGYTKLPNGLTFQWGVVTGWTRDNETKVVSFPIPFETACFSCVIVANTPMNAGDKGNNIVLNSFNTTEFNATIHGERWNVPSGGWPAVKAWFIAIGV